MMSFLKKLFSFRFSRTSYASEELPLTAEEKKLCKIAEHLLSVVQSRTPRGTVTLEISVCGRANFGIGFIYRWVYEIHGNQLIGDVHMSSDSLLSMSKSGQGFVEHYAGAIAREWEARIQDYYNDLEDQRRREQNGLPILRPLA